MLSQDQIETYRRDGFIVVEGVFSAAEVADLREVTDSFVERDRSVTEQDIQFDLEPSHTLNEPRIRRIKTPHAQHAVYHTVMRQPGIERVLQQLPGSIRLDTSLEYEAVGLWRRGRRASGLGAQEQLFRPISACESAT